MKAFSSDDFVFPLPAGHRFPLAKYARLRERVCSDLAGLVDVRVAPAATDSELGLAHSSAYLDKVAAGRLAPAELRELGFPWSPALVERSRRSTGATIAAARAALEDGVGVNLAGGTHHAFADAGRGYCVFNDVAVAARVLRRERRVARVLIVDCDVHQGDGTAAILAGDEAVFTLSIHAAANYPFRKQRSDIDVALADGTGDEAYLDALRPAVDRAFEAACPELVFYLAGADPFVGDRIGRLALRPAGLARRDEWVFDRCEQAGVPVAVAMAGGYAADIEAVVEIHLATVRAAAESAVRRRLRISPRTSRRAAR